METNKKDYMEPHVDVTHVEIESSICGGSVDFEAKPATGNKEGITTDPQMVNHDFASANDFQTSGEGWD